MRICWQFATFPSAGHIWKYSNEMKQSIPTSSFTLPQSASIGDRSSWFSPDPLLGTWVDTKYWATLEWEGHPRSFKWIQSAVIVQFTSTDRCCYRGSKSLHWSNESDGCSSKLIKYALMWISRNLTKKRYIPIGIHPWVTHKMHDGKAATSRWIEFPFK